MSNIESNNDAVQKNENKVKNEKSQQQQINTKDWNNESFGKFQAIGSSSMDKGYAMENKAENNSKQVQNSLALSKYMKGC